ncbi:Transcription factor 25 [Podila epigama]|nr:Transcription factor 25 [Podila epigama]
MSSRAMKKLLRDSHGPTPLKDDALPSTTTDKHPSSDVEDEEDEEEYARPPARNLFALLNDDNDNEDDDDDDKVSDKEDVIVTPSAPKAGSKKKKKKKSKGSSGTTNPFDLLKEENEDSTPAEPLSPPAPTAAPSSTAPSTSKSKTSKNKKKKGKANTVEEMSIEEFEKSLQQVNQQLGSIPGDAGSSNKPALAPLKELLAVDTRFLDADAEMKKMFGARVVNSEIRDRRYAKATKKALLAQPRGTWPVRKATGLSMEVVDSVEENVTTFKIVHSEWYQRTQLKFLGAVASYDPNNLVALLRESPFHIDSLLQLSEVSKHNGDNSLAGEFIEQALYAFEKSFHSLFNIASGSVRLSFMHVENRSFFLAIHRHIQFLGRRGCWRTAFEFNKLLLSLDPFRDELGALLSIDFYALKAQEYNYLKRLYERLKNNYHLDRLPNFVYSIAMAQFHLESAEGKDHAESSKLLQRAILLFPTAVPLLADQGGFSVDSEMAHNVAFYPTKDLPNCLDLYIHLFVSRNFALWKEPEVISWLKTNVQTCVQLRLSYAADPEVQEAIRVLEDYSTGINVEPSTAYSVDGPFEPTIASEPSTTSSTPLTNVSLRVSRHVLVSDFNALARYLPQEIVMATMHMHDPLPPSGSRNVYEERFEAQRGGGLMGGARDAAQTMLEEVMRRIMPGAAGMGAAGLPEDQLRQVAEAVQMLQARMAGLRGAAGGRLAANIEDIPGAFPGADAAAGSTEGTAGVEAAETGATRQVGDNATDNEGNAVGAVGADAATATATAPGAEPQSIFRSLTDMMQMLGMNDGRAPRGDDGTEEATHRDQRMFEEPG